MSNDYFFYHDDATKSEATRTGIVGGALCYAGGATCTNGLFLAVNGKTVIQAGAAVVNNLVVVYRDAGRQGWHIARPDVRFAVVQGKYENEWAIGFLHEENARKFASELNAMPAAERDHARLHRGFSTIDYTARWAVIDLLDFTTQQHVATAAPDCAPRYVVKHRDELTLGEPCAPYGLSFGIAGIQHDCTMLNAGTGLAFAAWAGRKLWDHRNASNVMYAIVDTHDDWHRHQRAGVGVGAQLLSAVPRGITDADVCTAWVAFQAWREACDMAPAPVETQHVDGQLVGVYVASPDLPTKVFFTVAQCSTAWTNELQRTRPAPPRKLMAQIDCLDDHEEAYMPDEPSRLNDMASLVRELFVVPQ
jgi:hypothetical protein